MERAQTLKNKKSKKKNNKFKLVLIFAVVGYLTWMFSTQQVEIHNRKKELARIEAEIQQQQQIKISLEQKKELVNSPEYLEKIAREELGFARPDEIIFYDSTIKK